MTNGATESGAVMQTEKVAYFKVTFAPRIMVRVYNTVSRSAAPQNIPMLPFKLVYSEKYFLPIGEHVFRADKFRLIRERLLQQQVVEEGDFIAPRARPGVRRRAGALAALRQQTDGRQSLTAREELQMEIPYSPQVVDAFMLHTGGSILAAERALQDGVCINIGGGFHHAFPDHGEGFCMINDVAVAIRAMQKRKLIRRAMTVDCDVHQGNGTAAIFGKSGTRTNVLPSSSAPTLGAGRRAGCSDGEGRLHHLAAPGAQLSVREAAVVDRRQSARRLRRCRISRVARQRAQLRAAAVRAGTDLLRGGRRSVPAKTNWADWI